MLGILGGHQAEDYDEQGARYVRGWIATARGILIDFGYVGGVQEHVTRWKLDGVNTVGNAVMKIWCEIEVVKDPLALVNFKKQSELIQTRTMTVHLFLTLELMKIYKMSK
ncbi:hypothetical protein Fot_42174 [Forsythia ovata]|uniref:Uncharacterized protein n=1 Tax=Forsythia ovata TaxID=205694 RepID=A0ABD1RKH9_9LAMI